MENQDNNKDEVLRPHVKIFNKDTDSWDKEKDEKQKYADNHYQHYHYGHHHRHSGGGLFGLTLLFVGALLLLNNFGVVGKDVWNYIWPFWPIILILIGIRIVTGYNRVVGFFVFLLALVSFCAILLYALIHVGSPLIYNLHLSPNFINFISQLK